MKGWTEQHIKNLNVSNSTPLKPLSDSEIESRNTPSKSNLIVFNEQRTNPKSQPEFILQKQLCQFIRNQYPNIFFLSDTVASVRLTEPQQQRNKAIQNSNFHCPDLMILEPGRGFDGKIQYHGLFLELKVKSPFKKDGTLLKDEHLQKQFDTLARLNERGYKALFVWSMDAGIKIINEYLKK